MAVSIDGVVLLDKPLGITSHTATNKLRRLMGSLRAGHVGSLDPLATGMLPVCLGEATKVAGLVASHDKHYCFTVALGARTSTGDAEGEVIERLPVPGFSRGDVDSVLAAMRGPQKQMPPMYSAIKQGGQPLYRLARQGKTVEREPRPIVLHELASQQVLPDRITLSARCSKGTYVRVLGEDVARALGTCGFLVELRRDWVAPFAGRRMWSLEEIGRALEQGHADFLLPTSLAVPDLPRVQLGQAEATRLMQGQATACEAVLNGTCWLLDPAGTGLGLGNAQAWEGGGGSTIRPQRMFTRPLS